MSWKTGVRTGGNRLWRVMAFAVLLLPLTVPSAAGDGQSVAPPTARDLIQAGKYAEAQVAARESLTRELEKHGAGSPEAAVALDTLVESLWRGGKAQDPETRRLAAEAPAAKEAAVGPDDPGVAESLNNLGVVLFFNGDYAAAQPAWERALAIREASLGPEHPDVAKSCNSLANLLQTIGDWGRARELYERAIAIREKAYGPEHPGVAQSLANLAILLRMVGDYAEARPRAERALTIYEKALGPEHPKVANTLYAYGATLWDMGDYERARPQFERSMAILEKTLGPESTTVADSLNNMAELHRKTGNYETARPLFERALGIYEKAVGPEHPRVALCLDSLAELLEAEGDYAGALPMYERAAAIREKALGEHVDLANTLTSLGSLKVLAGEMEEARQLLERATDMNRNTLGAEHPAVADSLTRLAILQAVEGKEAAVTDALEAERIGREHLRLTGRSLAEQMALRYAAVRNSGLDLALSLAAAGLPAGERSEVLDALIRSRGVVLDEMAARHRGVSGSGDPVVADKWAEVERTRSRLANLTVRGVGSEDPDRYRAMLAEARETKVRAENDLATASTGFAREQTRGRLGLDEVRRALPAQSAVVSFAIYDRLPQAATDDESRARPHLQPTGARSSYMAFVQKAKASAVEVVPLGPADEIDTLVAAWKTEAAGGVSRGGDPAAAEARYRKAGEALRARIWEPLQEHLGKSKRVFVVPDGSLNLVSLVALPSGKNRYLLEDGPLIQYLSTERDLVPTDGVATSGRGLLALGGPDYDDATQFGERDEPMANGSSSATQGTRASCGTFATLQFAPLPEAAREAGEVVAFWQGSGEKPDAALHLAGREASEAAFKAAAGGRRILHLATHGFFLGGDCASGAGTRVGSRGLGLVTVEEPAKIEGISPLLLSGLALAGANYRRLAAPGEEDGILTAEEIAGMDLSGVEWAVLSACDTGVGEIQAGEGVFGLRRAVQVAGVRTLIMSLWPVDDRTTSWWMSALYQARLSQRVDTSQAVQAAGLDVLHRLREAGESTHPFYWGAFVAAGDWR